MSLKIVHANGSTYNGRHAAAILSPLADVSDAYREGLSVRRFVDFAIGRGAVNPAAHLRALSTRDRLASQRQIGGVR